MESARDKEESWRKWEWRGRIHEGKRREGKVEARREKRQGKQSFQKKGSIEYIQKMTREGGRKMRWAGTIGRGGV